MRRSPAVVSYTLATSFHYVVKMLHNKLKKKGKKGKRAAEHFDAESTN